MKLRRWLCKWLGIHSFEYYHRGFMRKCECCGLDEHIVGGKWYRR